MVCWWAVSCRLTGRCSVVIPLPSIGPELDGVVVVRAQSQTVRDAEQCKVTGPGLSEDQESNRSGERRTARGILRRLELLPSSIFASSGNPLGISALSAWHFGGCLGVVGR